VLTITDKAAEKARIILAEEGKDNWGIRIYNAGESCCGPSYGLDLDERPSAQDEVFEKDGLRVFVDRDMLSTLSGMQLDYYDDEEREGFILTGGAAPSCGPSCSSCG